MSSVHKIAQLSSVYVGIYVLSIPLWYLLHPYRHWVRDSYYLASVNELFAESYGHVLFTFVYLSHVLLFVEDRNSIPTPVVMRQLLRYALATVLAYVVNSWFFGPSITDRINQYTGGWCEPTKKLNLPQCKATVDNTWHDGFDLLSHYYMILTWSLLLLHNRVCILPALELARARVWEMLIYFWVESLTSFLLVVWLLEYCVTSLFFHTVGEKFAGLVAIPITLGIIHASEVVVAEPQEPESVV